jgi:hypothetical protein
MAISVNTVYQRVLAILNKEQRGYVTPEEFNLFANQAQLDIFEQYFYDINQFGRLPGNDTEYSDMLDNLNEKISYFEKTATLSYSTQLSRFTLPTDLYRVGTLIFGNKEVERVNKNEYLYISQAPLAKPTDARPIYVKDTDGFIVYGSDEKDGTDTVKINYIKKPSNVVWNYKTVLGNAQYKATGSVDFELEPSEEPDLVIKILGMCGVEVRDLSIYQLAAQEEIRDTQEEKQ